jgi:hypothetical protein
VAGRNLTGLLAAFFDTTALYFDGRAGATLGQRGFSKDSRPQLHQAALGITRKRCGRPKWDLLSTPN